MMFVRIFSLIAVLAPATALPIASEPAESAIQKTSAVPARESDAGPGSYEMTTYYVGFLYRGDAVAWLGSERPAT